MIEAENASALALERLPQGLRVDAGKRDIGSDPEHHERAEGEPDALLEFLGLREGPEIEIGGELLGG